MPTLKGEAEGPTRGADIATCRGIMRGHRPRARTEAPGMATGRSRFHRSRNMSGDASGSLRTHADDERTREVGQTSSTCEVPEQGWATGGGGDGGKRSDQREPATAKRVPDTEPERRAQCAAAGRSSRQGCETYGVKVPFRQLLVSDG